MSAPADAKEPAIRSSIRPLGGQQVDFDMASFKYLDDLEARFMFTGPRMMRIALPAETVALKLPPEQLLERAVENARRHFGKPATDRRVNGLYQIKAMRPGPNSAFMFDQAFWAETAKRFPDGVVFGLPSSSHVLFVPAGDSRLVQRLRSYVTQNHTTTRDWRASGTLYLLKDGQWSTFDKAKKN